MNTTLKIGLASAGSLLLGAGISGVIIRKLTKKEDQETITRIHSYYGEKMQEKRDVEWRLNAFVEVIDELPTETYTQIMEKVNAKLNAPEEENEDPGEIVDEETAKTVKVVPSSGAPESALDRTKVIGTPYHTMYKSGSEAIVEPARGVVAGDTLRNHPQPEETEEEDSEEVQEAFADNPPDPTANSLLSDVPFVITARECGTSWHDVECLTYYDGDGTLIDEADHAINIQDYIGEEHLGDFEDGLLYIRNDRLGMDYEVRWDDRAYSEVTGLVDAYENLPTREKMRRKAGQVDE